MELEDIKKGWKQLNEQLENTEIVNQKMIKEMIVERTTTARGKLFMMNLPIIIFIPILMIAFPLMYIEINIGDIVLMNIVTELLFAYSLFTELILIHYLHQMNIHRKTVSEIAYSTLMFKKWFKIRFVTGLPLALIFIFFYILNLHYSTNILKSSTFWITLGICIPIAIYASTKKIKKMFQTLKVIEKAIKDLKELKEE